MKKDFKNLLNELAPTSPTPGSTLRAFRKALDLTLKDMEDITAIKEPNLSALENDRMGMTVYYAEICAAALGVHPSMLIYPSGDFHKSEELKKIEKKAKKVISSKKAI